MNSPRSRLSGAAYTERAVEMVARLRDPCRTKLPVAQSGASGSQGLLWPERDLQPLGAGPPGRGLCQEQAFAPLHVWARGPYTRPVTPTQTYKACQQLHAAKSRSLGLAPENSPRVDPAKLRLTSGPWV